ncbi:type I-F CRISPR-associated endoribonuclease Cas6/Csy4 [Thiobaca trueperi]|uniref:CRISPR-associated Csy4 family protein n=1 Tax=Thiobaca trueperi TaxID=127458 RepID=A0A4R3MV13_9GAMM|nr:type I-F CRISPR-associated endoribonuclease Cas6/Csy4 [Thiobaca trueperi]TCT20164.1 CRISPR-associated Csy4 family protein [Thiobaca trueperi]
MDHYLEITLLPDPEFAPTVLMNALFAKLHRGLVDLSSTRIGVSFPGMRKEPKSRSLGERLRIHGSLADLRGLMDLPWLTGMRDHILFQGPEPIPDQVSDCRVRRVQAKSSPERLRRRLMRRRGIGEEAARQCIPDALEVRLDLPFVTLKSRSTGQTFRLFIEQQAVSQSIAGEFNNYGLSLTATVPWF